MIGFASLQQRFDLNRKTAEEDIGDVINRQRMASFVAVVAFGMPLTLLVVTAPWNCAYDSISHYYYSRVGGDVFVGSLFFIGAFLLAYRGEVRAETVCARIAAFAAFGVALFPTSDAGCQEPAYAGRAFVSLTTAPETVAAGPAGLFNLFGHADWLHFGCAAVMFTMLALFCLVIFTRVIDGEHRAGGARTAAKTWRNRIYVGCGLAILAAITALLIKTLAGTPDWWNAYNLTLYCEMLALWSFGLSWAVKGRFGPFRTYRIGRLVTDARDRAAPARSALS